MAVPLHAVTLLHYDFSDGSGTTVTDLSGNSNDGTLGGFFDTSAGAGVFAQTEGWVTGGGISTLQDGILSFVTTPLPLNVLGNGPFTLEFLASFTAPGQSSQGGNQDQFAAAIGNDSNPDPNFFADTLIFGWREGIGLEERLPGTNDDSVNATALQPWQLGTAADIHHIALTYTPTTPGVPGGDVVAFVDGVQGHASTHLPTVNFAGASSNFVISGSASNFVEWDGVMHGVAISNEALTPSTFVLQSTAASADFDVDGDVDGNDFLVWQRGGSPNPLGAADLALWQDQFGAAPPLAASTAAVPEPASSLLFLLGISVLAGANRPTKS